MKLVHWKFGLRITKSGQIENPDMNQTLETLD